MIRFHHYGVAVNDDIMNKWDHLNWTYDPNQNIFVAMSKVCDNVEYVCGKSVDRYIYDTYYHACYEVDDIDYYVSKYNEFGCIKIVDTTAELFNGRRIVFMTNGETLVEFLQCE